ncbi:MAG: hypothetical protein ACOH2M_13930 [Cypionkella sp.]
MSEPLSSSEIEDVLSSIRRLVSEDMRPVPRAPGVSPIAEVTEKLILTPALRVVESKPVERPNVAPRLHLNFPVMDEDDTSIETVVASVGAAVDAAHDDWEAENGDEDIAAAPPEWTFADADETLDEIYAPEASDQDVLVFASSASDAAAVTPGWAQTDEFDEPEHVAEMVEAVEPDPIWVAAAEASVIAALQEDSYDEAADQDFAEDGTDEYGEVRFNEDVLRELVRDILREELAGSMGERITRNIRKLVRAEIARSLAAQELS